MPDENDEDVTVARRIKVSHKRAISVRDDLRIVLHDVLVRHDREVPNRVLDELAVGALVTLMNSYELHLDRAILEHIGYRAPAPRVRSAA